MKPLRLFAAACLPIAAIGIALARGKKGSEAPPDPEPVTTAPESPPTPEPEPVAPAAPPLFADGLPVTLASLPSGLSSLSAQGCNACHWAAHDTWSGSAHARAGSGDTYRTALKSAGDSTACKQCHLPLTAQHDQLAAGYIDGDLTRPRLTPNPSFDLTLHGEGVTCAACHVRGDTVIGTRASPGAPHPVAVSPELSDPAMCATCHQLSWPEGDRPFYDTYGEWKASAYAVAGVTCQQCHMAPTTGASVPGSDGTLPSHALGADPRRALSALLSVPRATVTRGQAVTVGMTLQNTGAGHSFPTGSPFKHYRVDLALVDAANKDLGPVFSTVLARTVDPKPPYRTLTDTRLLAGGQIQLSHTFTPSVKGVAGKGAIEVRLVRGAEVIVLQRIAIEIT